jgi:hypothetical protein
VTTTQTTMVRTEEVSQTLNERTRQTIEFSSSNTKDEEWVPIENNSNLITPLLILLVFGTLEWIIKEGWLILLKKKKLQMNTKSW